MLDNNNNQMTLDELRAGVRMCLNHADAQGGEQGLPLMFGMLWAKSADDIMATTALAIELNHKAFAYAEDNRALAKAYDRLWKYVDAYVLDGETREGKMLYYHFKNDEVDYYIRETD